MIEYADALKRVRELAVAHAPGYRARSLCTERIEHALGLVVGETVTSPWDSPRFANSAMDGFAVRAAETAGASPERPLTLKIAGSLAAGDSFDGAGAQAPGVAWEIMTGAPVPDSFDAVIKVEEVSEADGRVTLPRPLAAGENVRPAGEDFRQGAIVAGAGQVWMPEHVLAAAGLGIASVAVRPKPRVAILSTGAELVAPSSGYPLRSGQIYNSTACYLERVLAGLGCEARSHGPVGDDPREFLSVLVGILESKPEVVITTGAVSMGKYDFIKPALGDLGAHLLFHKVAMRPGKPLLLAELKGGTVLFGLPGNPVSTAVGWRFFVEPYLRELLGRAPERYFRLRLAARAPKPEGLRCFFKARADLREGTVSVLPGQSSALVRPVCEANSWAILPEQGSVTEAGELIEVAPLHPLPYDGERSL